MFCPRCSQEQISEETKFCSRCGLSLGREFRLFIAGLGEHRHLALQCIAALGECCLFTGKGGVGLGQGIYLRLLLGGLCGQGITLFREDANLGLPVGGELGMFITRFGQRRHFSLQCIAALD